MSRYGYLYVKRNKKTGIFIFLLFVFTILGLVFLGHKVGAFDPIVEYVVSVDEAAPTSHVLIVVNIKDEDHKLLVPPGRETEDSVSELHAKINLLWETSPRDDSLEGLLHIKVKSIINEEGIDVSDLIYVEFASSMQIDSNKPGALPIVIKMHEPENAESYHLVANQVIKIIFEFNVTRN